MYQTNLLILLPLLFMLLGILMAFISMLVEDDNSDFFTSYDEGEYGGYNPHMHVITNNNNAAILSMMQTSVF